MAETEKEETKPIVCEWQHVGLSFSQGLLWLLLLLHQDRGVEREGFLPQVGSRMQNALCEGWNLGAGAAVRSQQGFGPELSTLQLPGFCVRWWCLALASDAVWGWLAFRTWIPSSFGLERRWHSVLRKLGNASSAELALSSSLRQYWEAFLETVWSFIVGTETSSYH